TADPQPPTAVSSHLRWSRPLVVRSRVASFRVALVACPPVLRSREQDSGGEPPVPPKSSDTIKWLGDLASTLAHSVDARYCSGKCCQSALGPRSTRLSPPSSASSPEGGNSPRPSPRLTAMTTTPVPRPMSASRSVLPTKGPPA